MFQVKTISCLGRNETPYLKRMAAAVKESGVIVFCVAANGKIASMIQSVALQRKRDVRARSAWIRAMYLQGAWPVSGRGRTARDDKTRNGRSSEGKDGERNDVEHGC